MEPASCSPPTSAAHADVEHATMTASPPSTRHTTQLHGTPFGNSEIVVSPAASSIQVHVLPPSRRGGLNASFTNGPFEATSEIEYHDGATQLHSTDSLRISRFGDTSVSAFATPRATECLGRVVEGVYVGPFKEATNLETIRRFRITAFLCVAAEMSRPAFITDSDLASGKVAFLHIPLADSERTILSEHFAAVFGFIDHHRKNLRNTLLYCQKGQSRSASFAVAYMLHTLTPKLSGKFNSSSMLQVLKRRYPAAEPNFAFRLQLASYFDRTQHSAGAVDDGNPLGTPSISLVQTPHLGHHHPDFGSSTEVLDELSPTFGRGVDDSDDDDGNEGAVDVALLEQPLPWYLQDLDADEPPS